MSTPPDTSVKLSKTLTLCEYVSPRSGHFGFWLYDATRGMNLSMRAKSSTDAFVEALTYYQKRLARIEAEHAAAVEDLPRHHQDPFDRLLIAQALTEPMRLMTHDPLLALYSDTVIKV